MRGQRLALRAVEQSVPRAGKVGEVDPHDAEVDAGRVDKVPAKSERIDYVVVLDEKQAVA